MNRIYTTGNFQYNRCVDTFPDLDAMNCLNNKLSPDDPIFDYCKNKFPSYFCQNKTVTTIDPCSDTSDNVAYYCGRNPNADPEKECAYVKITDDDSRMRRMFYCSNPIAKFDWCKFDEAQNNDYLYSYCEYSKNAKSGECRGDWIQKDAYCNKNKLIKKDEKFCKAD